MWLNPVVYVSRVLASRAMLSVCVLLCCVLDGGSVEYYVL